MGENIEVKDVQKTEYLDKNGLDMLWAKVKENTRNQVEAESNRAVEQETRIIETKADKSEFSNYVPSATFTALEKKVSANTAAISNKQNAGNYLHYETLNNEGYYEISSVCIPGSGGSTKTNIDSQSISINDDSASCTTITPDSIVNRNNDSGDLNFTLDRDGLKLEGGDDFSVLTSNGSTIDITQYAKKTEVSDFVSKTTTNDQSIKSRLNISNALKIKGDNNEAYAVFLPTSDDIQLQMISTDRSAKTYLDPSSLQISKSIYNITITANGIRKSDGSANYVYATDGSIADLTQYAKKSEITAGGNVDDVQVNGVSVVENKIANIKPATKEEYGVVKVGDGLNVADGTISVDTTAIGSGKYIPYETFSNDTYYLQNGVTFGSEGEVVYTSITNSGVLVRSSTKNGIEINGNYLFLSNSDGNTITFNSRSGEIEINRITSSGNEGALSISGSGIYMYGVGRNRVLTADASTIDITQYALKSELPTVPTKVSQLQNDSEFITKSVYDEKIAALESRIAALEAKHTETA